MLNATVSGGRETIERPGGVHHRSHSGPSWPSPWRPCRDLLEFETVLRRRTRRPARRGEWGLGLLHASVTMVPVGTLPLDPADADHANLVLDVRVGGEIDGSWAAIRSAPGEYLVLCHHLRGVTDARGLARRVANRLAWPLEVGTRLVVPRVCVGIALERVDGSGADDLVERSEEALRRARQRTGLQIAVDSGRGRSPDRDG